MRAAVFHGRQDLRLQEVPEPQAGSGEVKLRVLYNSFRRYVPANGPRTNDVGFKNHFV